MTLPFPVLDHIVVNVHERMDEAAETYRRLGFTLTPRGYHTLGSINHLAIFATDYMELIGVPTAAGGGSRKDILGWPVGWNGLVFNTEDAAGLTPALASVGVPASAPNDFSRPVELPGGVTADAAFRTVRLPNDTSPSGRIYFCEHKTRPLVWRDAWRRHANGTVAIARFVFGAADPLALSALFARMFGPEPIRRIPGGAHLAVGMASVEVVSPAEISRRYGEAAADPAGRSEWMAAVEFRTAHRAQAEAALTAGGVPFRATAAGPLVAGRDAFGAAMLFTE